MNARFMRIFAISAAAAGAASLSVQAALFPSGAIMDHILCCGADAKTALHAMGDPPSRLSPALAVVAAAAPSAATEVASDKRESRPDLEQEDGYVKIGFDRLASYVFRVPEFDPAANPNVSPPTGEEQIPAWLKELSGRKAKVTGFMLPTKLENSLVTEFLLLSDPMMCCYGAVPEMNQWIVVKMKKGGVKPIQDVPVSFFGDLKVGAMFENGYMTGIYALDCDKMGEIQE